MIKSLLNADEDPPPGTKVIIEETIVSPPALKNEPGEIEEASESTAETRPGFEIPEDAKFFAQPPVPTAEAPQSEEPVSISSAPLDEDAESLSALMANIEDLDDKDLDLLEKRLENAGQESAAIAPEASMPAEIIAENPPPTEPVESPKTFDASGTGTLFQTEIQPRPSMAESIRQSGLAYSAAIVLFGSVIFMMILGWFADLLLGTSPWGIVGGIILGGIVGFIQFFRITSQIFKK